jgi:hypothetical protein
LVPGDKVDPAIYAAKIENCGDCWVTVHLDANVGAFQGHQSRAGLAVFGDPRSTVASAFARRPGR